jgi:hypothetical protein
MKVTLSFLDAAPEIEPDEDDAPGRQRIAGIPSDGERPDHRHILVEPGLPARLILECQGKRKNGRGRRPPARARREGDAAQRREERAEGDRVEGWLELWPAV